MATQPTALDDLLGYRDVVDDETLMPRRSKLRLVGATVEDDPATGATKITVSGGGGGAVDSFNTRTGPVVSVGGDYALSQITDDSSMAAGSAKSAVEALAGATSSLAANKADKTTSVTAGIGLTGGGDLSANRTLGIDVSGGSIGQALTKTGASTTGWMTVGLTAPSGGADAYKVVTANAAGTDVAYSTAVLDAAELDLGARDLTTTGDVSARDADFTGDVTADTVDTSDGTAPTGYAVGLKNGDSIAIAGGTSGVSEIYVDADDRLVATGFADELTQLVPTSSGTRARQDLAATGDVNTTTTASTELVRLTLPDGFFGPVVFTVGGRVQTSEATNNLLILGTILVSTVSGVAVVLASFGDSPTLNGTASTWTIGSGVSGLDLVVNVTGQSSGTVEWNGRLDAGIRPGLAA